MEALTSHYVACLGAYRALYILNWIVRYYTENYVRWIVWIPGLIQTVLYLDFFYYYLQSRWYGTPMTLPTNQ